MIDLLFDKKWTIIKVVLPTFFYKKLVFGPFLRVELLDLTEKTATSSSSTGHFGHSARSSSSAFYPAVGLSIIIISWLFFLESSW